MAYGNQVKTDSLSTTYTQAVYPLGTTYVEQADEVTAGDASLGGDRVWLFIRAGGAIAAGDILVGSAATRNIALQTTALANINARHLVGVAAHAIANNDYGWVIARGEAVVKSAGVSAGDQLATVGTAGTVGPGGSGSVAAGLAQFGLAKTATAGGFSDVFVDLL